MGATFAFGLSLAAIFPLHLFPEGGLSRSIITTVYVGLIVIVFFNETFGWVLTGMVVPGYLAPILLIQPWSGAVIILEGLTTYLVVRLVSDRLNRLRLWTMFFGRDRFFAFILFGVAVRAVSEGLVLPAFGSWLNQSLGIYFDYRNAFYSIGLVVVPLLANMLWKTGFLRGMVPVGTVIGTTYALIALLLIPYTNFSISNFELSYGYFATSFLGNVKAYVILIATAYLASRSNLRYGWDYNGILIPSLLALAWFEPLKIATTFVEAILVMAAARWVANRKLFETVTIAGGRRILLCFTLGFTLKMGVGFWLADSYPGLDSTDLYGFGYILPSLLASKMWQKGVAVILRPVLQTSLLGMLLGSAVSALLVTYLPVGIPEPEQELAAGPAHVTLSVQEMERLVSLDQIKILRLGSRHGPARPFQPEVDRFRAILDQLDRGITPAQGVALAGEAMALGLQLVRFDDADGTPQAWYLREATDDPERLKGWGLYLVNARPKNDLVLQVPRPLYEPWAVEAGLTLFQRLEGRALIIAGSDPRAGGMAHSDVVRTPYSLFQTAHLLFRRRHVVQVRTVPRPTRAGTPFFVLPGQGGGGDPPPLRSELQSARKPELWLKTEIPDQLDLDRLAAILGQAPVKRFSGESRFERDNVQRDTSWRTFTIAFLPDSAIPALLGGGREHLATVQRELPVASYLLSWFESQDGLIARRGSQAYRPPSLAELAYLDQAVVAPLVRYQEALLTGQPFDPVRLWPAARAARHLGYELVRYQTRSRLAPDGSSSGPEHLILREAATGGAFHHWGTYVFRMGPARPYGVEVPHPHSEIYTLEVGIRLFGVLPARALLLAGASKLANVDEQSNVSHPRHLRSAFHLVHQILLREAAQPPLMVQLKGFPVHPTDPEVDAVMSTGRERPRGFDDRDLDRLAERLAEQGAQVRRFDGGRHSLPYRGVANAQFNFTERHFPGRFVYLWLSQDFRARYRLQSQPLEQREQLFRDLGLPVRQVVNARYPLERILSRVRGNEELGTPGPTATADEVAGTEAAIGRLEAYRRVGNVVLLEQARVLAEETGATMEVLFEQSLGRVYLVLRPPFGARQKLYVANLTAVDRAGVRLYWEDPALLEKLGQALRRNVGWIRIEGR